MSGTVSSTYASAIAAAQASAAANAATSSSSSSSSSSGTGGNGTTTLTALAGNFNDFLTLLTTRLQNQDPTAPMDTNQFTSQLVQFTGVAEQIQTNSTLTSLLSAAQTQQLGQAFRAGWCPGVDFRRNAAAAEQHGAGEFHHGHRGTSPDSRGEFQRSDGCDADGELRGRIEHLDMRNGLNSNAEAVGGRGLYGSSCPARPAVPFQSVGTVTGAEQLNGAVNWSSAPRRRPTARLPLSQRREHHRRAVRASIGLLESDGRAGTYLYHGGVMSSIGSVSSCASQASSTLATDEAASTAAQTAAQKAAAQLAKDQQARAAAAAIAVDEQTVTVNNAAATKAAAKVQADLSGGGSLDITI